eukprot:scaffold192707_cov34-Prasinocladus_malaysianus.AAC.1
MPLTFRPSKDSLKLAERPRGLVSRRADRKATRSAWNAADDFVALTVVDPAEIIDGTSEEASVSGSSRTSPDEKVSDDCDPSASQDPTPRQMPPNAEPRTSNNTPERSVRYKDEEVHMKRELAKTSKRK